MILDTAMKVGIYVCFHLEPYKGRTVETTRADVEYIFKEYGKHPAFYRDPNRKGKSLFYIYDSYLISSDQWNKLFSSVRELHSRKFE